MNQIVKNTQFLTRVFNIPYKECGRDYDGIDCWGLVVLCHKELLGIEIPIYEDILLTSMSNYKSTTAQITEQMNSYFPFDEITSPKFGDSVLINMLGQPLHIGFVLDATTMLHTTQRTGVVSETFRGLKWQKRIKGFYRYSEKQSV